MPKKSDSFVEAVKHSIAGTCGHINKQHYGIDGKLQDLVCDLPDGHEPVLLRTEKVKDVSGNISQVPVYGVVHSAEYEYLRVARIPTLKQRVEGEPVTHEIAKRRGEWTDAAGVPARQQPAEE
jgi:hypothetical protein